MEKKTPDALEMAEKDTKKNKEKKEAEKRRIAIKQKENIICNSAFGFLLTI